MKILKAFKIRVYPNKSQEILINKTLGSCRFLYNQMLSERQDIYQKLKDNKRELYEHKYKTEKDYKLEFDWMKEVDSMSLQQARIDLSNAYSNFFKSLSGKRKGSVGFPKFKKKKDKNSYRTVQNIQIDFDGSSVKLPKLGWIKFRDKRKEFKGEIKQATVSKTKTGKYFVSVLFEQEIETKTMIINTIPKDKVVGLDMSLSSFFVDNNGSSPAYEKLFRINEKKLAKLQRKNSKKLKGSKNKNKHQLRINRIHEKIVNSRKDFTHKLSTELVRKYDVIVVENLNLKAMGQCLNLGKSIQDLGYGEFLKQVEYKCDWNSKLFFKADKWFASSKTCSFCGTKNSTLTLDVREWVCSNCGTIHNRDVNAGKNLQQWGINILGLEQSKLTPMEFKTSDF